MALIPDYPPLETPDEETTFVVDTGTQTFSMKMGPLLAFMQSHLVFPTPPPAIPPGTVFAYAGYAGVPEGYLECNGQTVSRETYAALFDAINIAHGAGDGSTTFHLPDYRGRFLRGVDGTAGRDQNKTTRSASNSGGNSGNNVGSVQLDSMQNLTGNFAFTDDNSPAMAVRVREAAGAFGLDNGNTNFVNSNSVPAAVTLPYRVNFDASRQARTSTETRPQNSNVLYIIKT
ncbi:tail collar protein [Bdellovibrio phage phi1402]|uniref:tail collar protein n=1 Tax=Bdellovibrio phage phi1402 TaxID=1035662 RepID=UPI000211A2DF|nr:tail collar protein [Bdellovibrio phage phi1402]AEG42330.1 phage tail collar protein [Bdellovibrio phage phi1402]